MNQFQHMFHGEIQSVALRDIVNWAFNGKWSNQLMIYQKEDGKIGLMDINQAISQKEDFDNLHQMEAYLKDIKVDDDQIRVVSSSDWVVYVP